MGDTTHAFTEPAGMAVLGSDGVWQMVTTSNAAAAFDYYAYDKSHWIYGCTRDNYTTFRTISETSTPAFADLHGDPSGFYRSRPALEGAAGSRAFFVHMIKPSGASGNTGVRIFDSANPCSSDTLPPWHNQAYTLSPDGSLDHPHFIYDYPRDQGDFVAIQDCISCNPVNSHLVAGNVNWNNTAIVSSMNLTSFSPRAPTTALDSSGTMHIVYYAMVDGSIRHTTFNPFTSAWGSHVVVGYAQQPSCVCGFTPVLCHIGAEECMFDFPSPSIAIDRSSSPNHIVVTYSTSGSGGCADVYEQRMYLSTDGGSNWAFEAVTGCQNSVLPEVTTTHVDGFADIAGRFHIVARYTNQSGEFRQLAVVDWKSTDGGVHWSGAYISGYISIASFGGVSGGYWGDYQQAAPDPAHGKMFAAWMSPTPDAYGPVWNIRGVTYDQ